MKGQMPSTSVSKPRSYLCQHILYLCSFCMKVSSKRKRFKCTIQEHPPSALLPLLEPASEETMLVPKWCKWRFEDNERMPYIYNLANGNDLIVACKSNSPPSHHRTRFTELQHQIRETKGIFLLSPQILEYCTSSLSFMINKILVENLGRKKDNSRRKIALQIN